MNIFKKIYCRVLQSVLKLAIPLLPYREPVLLDDYAELVKELLSSECKSVLLVTDKTIKGLGLTDALVSQLEEKGVKVAIFDETVANPTTDNVAKALGLYHAFDCKALIGFGGGSAIDCAKAVGARVACPKKSLMKMKGILKVRRKLPPLCAIPTTAGTGSETTIASVITDSVSRHKYAINDFPLIPKYAILDANLTLGLPQFVTATTGMDALTHAVEAYIGKSTTKQTRQQSTMAIKLIFENLLTAYNDGSNLKARQSMLYASYLAGLAFTKSYVGYVHAVAHSLGGKYNLPHGEANAICLPVVLKKYGRSIYKKLYKIATQIGLCSPATSREVASKIFIESIEILNKKMSIRDKIPEIKGRDIPELAATAEKEANPLYPVPKLFTAKELEKIYSEVSDGQ